MISVLFGIFSILCIYLYLNIFHHTSSYNKDEFFIENFVNNKDTPFQVAENKPVDKILNNVPVLPSIQDKFMLLTTINDSKYIVNNQSRWYDNDIDLTTLNMTSINDKLYFTLNNTITFAKDSVFNSLNGSLLNNVQLNGPNVLNFSNSKDNLFSLTNFSAVFLLKMNHMIENATFIEILCNTSISNVDKSNYDYIPNVISLIFKPKDSKFFDAIITFGNNFYSVIDIHINTIINDSIIIIALTFDSSMINLHINNKIYKFSYKKLNSKESITLGTQPFVINKNGKMDCVLYAFAYYKKSLSIDELTDFKKYMMYYLSGSNKIIEEKEHYENKLLQVEAKEVQKIKQIENISKLLDKCSTSKDESLPQICKTEPLNKIPHIETPYPSANV